MKLVAEVSSSMRSAPAPRLHSLHHVGRLGGGAAGVLRGEVHRVLSIWQMVDKGGDVHMGHSPSILRPYLHGCVIGDDILSPVPLDVVVHAQLQGFQKGGFAVVAASHDEGDAPGDRHPLQRPFMGKGKLHLHAPWALKHHSPLHGLVRDAALPGQDSAVGHKGRQISLL